MKARILPLLLVHLLAAAAFAAPDGKVDFNREIRPILADKCFACHGPDAKQVKADLRLDLRDNATRIGKNGRGPIVPRMPEASELVRRIFHTDPDEVMPPPKTHKILKAREKEALKQWIAEGAEYEEHWSFIPPKRPQAPAVKDTAWTKNEVDRFILARLEAAGLKPSKEADHYKLIRRVSLDLRGLPPSLKEVDQYINDEKPGAYQRMVDRMMSSPHFGEKMALLWMDLGRYGDTNGYHYDSTRQVWLWREWVINAYNNNMPYDRFTREQLAGDLLPDASVQNKIASGFNRNTRYNEEGGADPAEFRVRYAVDRTNVLGQVWLGLTVGCAECHSHKYDPISHKEFYQLYAFFNSFDEPGSQGHRQKYPPFIQVLQQSQQDAIDRSKAEISRIEKLLLEEAAKIEYKEPEGEKPEKLLDQPAEFVWVDDTLPGIGKPEGNKFEWVSAPKHPVHSGKRSMKRVSAGNQQHFFTSSPRKLKVAEGDKLFAWIWIDAKKPPREIMLQWNSQGAGPGWLHRAYWGENLIGWGADNSTQRRPMGKLPEIGKWVKLEVDAAHVGLMPGMIIHGLAFTQYDGVAYWDTAGIVSRISQGPMDYIWIDDEPPEGVKLQGEGQNGKGPWVWVEGKNHQVQRGKRATRRQGNGLNQHFFTEAKKPLPIKDGDKLFAHVWLDPKDPPKAVQLQFNDGSWSHRAYWGEDLCHGRGNKGASNHKAGQLPELGKWVRIEVPVKDVGLKPGSKLNGWAFTQFGGTIYYDTAGVSTWSPPDARHLRSLLAWEEIAKNDKEVPEGVRKAIGVAAGKRTAEQKAAVKNYYVANVFEETREQFASQQKQLKEQKEKEKKARGNTPFQLVTVEMAKRRPAFVLMRGNFQTRGEEVKPDVPAIFKPFPAEKARNRLGLSYWLTDPEHPLVARVTVNRYWAQLFGTGIVKSVGDFGKQGDFPTHPDLLDWLAVEYVEAGWDTKAIMKKIVMSSTYRQSSVNDHRYDEIDPQNKLLWRAPRFRLMAEEIRDTALQISGLLNPEIGGRPVNPYQPAGYYKGKFNWKWPESKGKDLYRRGMYTFWRRTTPYPTFLIFDAQDRSECVVKRPRTNTPLQALTTLNDPQFVEAARVFGQRIMQEGPSGINGKLVFAFRSTLARPPVRAEMDELKKIFREQVTHYKADKKAAEQLASAGKFERPKDLDPTEHAAWTAVANVLLNLDETVTRE